MKSLTWVVILLGAALVAVSVRLGIVNSSKDMDDMENTEQAQNAAYESIMTRTSVRKYTSQAIPDSITEKILRAGMAAPSAMNKQPWAFVAITDSTLRQEIASQFKNASMVEHAPLAIIVCGDMSLAIEGEGQDYWIQDCSAATENILLAAHALGLGAVWCGITPIKERMDAMRVLINLPDNLVPLNIVAIGYPEGPTAPKDKWDTSKIHYNKFIPG